MVVRSSICSNLRPREFLAKALSPFGAGAPKTGNTEPPQVSEGERTNGPDAPAGADETPPRTP